MQDFLEIPRSPSLFVESCDVLSGNFSPDIDSLEAYTVKQTCYNPYRHDIVTCKDPDKDLFLDEIQGLSLSEKLSSNLSDLPFYIPVFDRNVSTISSLSEIFPVVSLTLNDIVTGAIINDKGVLREGKKIGFRSNLLHANCFADKKVILFNTGPDTLIEFVWRKRSQYDFYNKIKKMGFSCVGGFNFSLINGECPFGHALNIKRSLYSSFEAENFGNVAMPHIYALTRFHVKKWLKWLVANPNVNYITTNCQLQHSREDIAQLAQATKAILDGIPYLHIVLQGFPFSSIKEHFSGYINRLHFADKQPLKRAQSHLKITYDDEIKKLVEVYSPIEVVSALTTHNFHQRLVQLNNIKSEMIKSENNFCLGKVA